MNTILMLFIFVPILSFILFALNLLLAVHKPYEAKQSAYECGFPALLGQTRSPVTIDFVNIILLFLAFDCELTLIFPLATNLFGLNKWGLSVLMVLFAILSVGFVAEIGNDLISISKKFTIINNNQNINDSISSK